MTEDEVRRTAFAMPLTTPAYPRGPYRFIDREFLTITYRTDPDRLGAWTGPAALELFPHALAPLADLPVRSVVSAVHLVADLTLGLGKVVHDYLA